MSNPRKVEAEVQSVSDYGHGVYSLILKLPRAYTRFKPGQFMHLTVDPFDPVNGFWPESRVFSIASQPKTDTIRLVYSVKGRYTKRIRDNLQPGTCCWLKLSYGDFSIEKNLELDRSIILVAGGTGIPPFIPYLLDDSKISPDRTVLIYYGVRNPKFLIFEEN